MQAIPGRPLSFCVVAILVAGISLPATNAAGQVIATVNPHGSADLPVDCSACHSERSFAPAKKVMDFDHNAQTAFQLIGRHSDVSCLTCHLGGRFDEPTIETASDCATCHVDVHQGTFQSTCTTCHNETSFQDVNGLALHAQTAFPLTGAHEQIACEQCHTDDLGGAFASLDTSCETCHEDDYYSSATLDHAELGFPQTCETCHSTLTWTTGVFASHAATSGGFELVGAHRVAACESCHTVPGFGTKFQTAGDDDCFSCHADDYAGEHQGSGFPTTCSTCHNSNDWDDARFVDHDRDSFPIYSGDHRGEWPSCQTCHTVPGDYQIFTCLVCHEHRQPKMDDEHRERSGYVYESSACLDCHPRGTE